MAKDNLLRVFHGLKKELKRYSPPLVERRGGANTGKPQYHVWSVKDVVIAGRPRNEVYFAGLIIQKGYVGLYYMPVYGEPKMKKFFAPELLKLLKGKSCFHIRELTPALKTEIRNALALGFRQYKRRGWV